jgi:hypothetical protein
MSDNGGARASATGGIGLVTVILALIFLFLWPGPLRYEYRQSSDGVVTTKIDRWSHQIWTYDVAGRKWEKQRE